MDNIYTMFSLDFTEQPPQLASSTARLSGALNSIMAAVVGVIANLFIWFALHLFFNKTSTFDFGVAQILLPNFATLDIRVTAIAIICGWLGFLSHVGLFSLLGIAALAGILSSMPVIQ